MREIVILACQNVREGITPQGKQKNYNGENRTKKYCKFCKAHTVHKEIKS